MILLNKVYSQKDTITKTNSMLSIACKAYEGTLANGCKLQSAVAANKLFEAVTIIISRSY